jgi:glycosyltransferase involved in cell wall biosynthesis
VRILRVANVPRNRLGGMSRAMFSAGDILASRGHEVEYLFREEIGPFSSRLGERFALPWRVASLIRDRQKHSRPYDVVEIHEPISIGFGLRNRCAVRPALAVFSHGLEARSRQESITYLRSKGTPVSLKQRFSPLSVVWQARLGLRQADVAICLNEEDRAELHKSLPTARVCKVRNGVGDEFLDAAPADAARASSSILFLGSWLPRKGILDLVPAVSSVLRKWPSCTFTAAGTGVDAEPILGAFPADVVSRVRVIPKVSSDQDLIRIYRDHSLFVLPSYFEGMPLSLLEAASMKLGVVATDCCGMKDFVRSGVNGLLVPVGSPPELARALDRCLADPPLTARMGEEAHRTVQQYRWDRATDDLEEAYSRAILNRRRVVGS